MTSVKLYLIALIVSLKGKYSNLRYFVSSYVINSQTITDMVQVTIANIYEVIHGLLNYILTFDLGSM